MLLIDNYDSFVHNLARYLRRLGQPTRVVRNDVLTSREVEALSPKAIVLSPGPGRPESAGNCLAIVRRLAGRVPILGVCLGHQVIAEAFDARVVRAPAPMHGRSSMIQHFGRGVFDGLPSPMRVGRYHSLVVDPQTMPNQLETLATTEDGIVMAFQHRELPIVGLQFHPESVLTEHGYDLLVAFLRQAQLPIGRDAAQLIESEMPTQRPASSEHRFTSSRPITF